MSAARARSGSRTCSSRSRAANRAISRCFTAAATIRPARTSAKTSGARSREVVVDRGLSRSSTWPIRASAAASKRMRSACALMLESLRPSRHRAKLRQEFQRVSRPRRFAVDQDPIGRDQRDRDGPRLPDRPRDVVDAARSWRRRGPDRARRSGASRAVAGRTRRHARPDQLGASSASPRPIRGWRSSGGSTACSRCFRCRRSRC